MLNKQICKKCFMVEGFSWREVEDKAWIRKEIFCPSRDKFGAVIYAGNRIDNGIPKYCNYRLEHMVINQNEIKQRSL